MLRSTAVTLGLIGVVEVGLDPPEVHTDGSGTITITVRLHGHLTDQVRGLIQSSARVAVEFEYRYFPRSGKKLRLVSRNVVLFHSLSGRYEVHRGEEVSWAGSLEEAAELARFRDRDARTGRVRTGGDQGARLTPRRSRRRHARCIVVGGRAEHVGADPRGAMRGYALGLIALTLAAVAAVTLAAVGSIARLTAPADAARAATHLQEAHAAVRNAHAAESAADARTLLEKASQHLDAAGGLLAGAEVVRAAVGRTVLVTVGAAGLFGILAGSFLWFGSFRWVVKPCPDWPGTCGG